MKFKAKSPILQEMFESYGSYSESYDSNSFKKSKKGYNRKSEYDPTETLDDCIRTLENTLSKNGNYSYDYNSSEIKNAAERLRNRQEKKRIMRDNALQKAQEIREQQLQKMKERVAENGARIQEIMAKKREEMMAERQKRETELLRKNTIETDKNNRIIASVDKMLIDVSNISAALKAD